MTDLLNWKLCLPLTWPHLERLQPQGTVFIIEKNWKQAKYPLGQECISEMQSLSWIQ